MNTYGDIKEIEVSKDWFPHITVEISKVVALVDFI